MQETTFVTIPKAMTGKEELVIIPKKILELLLKDNSGEDEVLRWSREAKKMKKAGKLSLLHSLKDLR
ncbi:MAG: hypothetical protein KGZ58_05510 [Ignavibacteriales bacterium]|nr:hypothetical protein [Ignavibacteriales bacterium]